MRSEDRPARDAVSPPRGYGNKDEAEREAARKILHDESAARHAAADAAAGAAHPPSAARVASAGALTPHGQDVARATVLRANTGRTPDEEAELAAIDRRIVDKPPGPSDQDVARFVFLRAKPNRTDVEEDEFDALDLRIVDKPAELAPLTPAEIGKLAESRAAGTEPDADLVAREGVPIPEPVIDRDPALVPQMELDLMNQIVALLLSIVDTVPMMQGHRSRVAEMRARLDLLIYHATPEPETPREALNRP